MMHLVENISVSGRGYRQVKTLTESECTVHVTENDTDNVYRAKAVYTFPISRPDVKNLNGRIYPASLWENVIRKKQGENTFGLMNHPKDDGSVKDIWCVWKNLRFSEDRKLLLCDAYLVGRNGEDVKEMLEAGGRIGLSTSGFGEFTADNVTLNSDTFELERVADFVFNPSAQVYGEQIDIVSDEDDDRKIESSTEGKETVTKEITSMTEDTNMDENKKNVSPLLEKSMRLNLQSVWKELKTEKDLLERIRKEEQFLTESNEPFTQDIHTEVMESLARDKKAYDDFAQMGMTMDATKAELNEQIVVLKNENKTLTESLTQTESNLEMMGEKLKKAEVLLDTLKEYSSKMKESYRNAVAEKNSMIDCGRYKEALAYGDQCDKQIERLKEQIADSEDRLDELQSFKEENDDLKSKIKSLEEVRSSLIKAKKEYLDQISSLKKQIRGLKRKLEDVYISSDDKDLEVSVKTVTNKDSSDEDESQAETTPEEDKNPGEAVVGGEETADTVEDTPTEPEEEEKKEESTVSKPNVDVRLYYRDLYKKNPNVIKIREDILKCRSVLEAQRTYSRLHMIVDMDSNAVPSGRKTESTTEDRVAVDHDKLTLRALNSHKGWN